MLDFMLSVEQARVLGCLIEKAVTTPDTYPMSLNSIRVACNQSTNREPVVDYDENMVQHALDGLRDLEFAARSKAHGERAIKYRHLAQVRLGIEAAECYVLCVMLLRGGQTPGELKQRTDRMHAFATTAEVESVLESMADRGLVARLVRRPGQKETRWTQLLAGIGASDVAHSDSGSVEPRIEVPSAPTAASIVVIDPATGALVRRVEVADDADIMAKLRRARDADATWSHATVDHRAVLFDAWSRALLRDADRLATIMTAESGLACSAARREIDALVDHLDSVAMSLRSEAAVTDVGAGEGSATAGIIAGSVPVGVVACITAGHRTLDTTLAAVAAAMASGNAVLFLPARNVVATALEVVELAHGVGIPIDVLQCVTGTEATGEALARSGVDLVHVVAPAATARSLHQLQAKFGCRHY